MMRTHGLPAVMGLSLLFLLASCGGISPKPTRTPVPNAPGRDFSMKLPAKTPTFTKKEELMKAEEESGPFEYRLGPGDIIGLKVWRRPELSEERLIVSPDGFIAAPRVGMISVVGKTPEEIKSAITKKLEILYINPEVTIQVHEFLNNKAYVLGNVNSPGMVRFTGRGSLLEGLSLAGGVPKDDRMTRCSIIRGSSQVIWIDLQDLLNNGNMSLNAPIRNNDIIYVPERANEMVYVMGEVKSPGAIQLHSGMSVLKAVMMAGGMSRKANGEKVFIIRQQEVNGSVVEVNLENLIEQADFSKNYTLMADDIVYVSPSGMAKFNYSIEDIMPALQIINLGTSAVNSVNSTIVIPAP
ncbi:SLBB domain-containing protein [Chlorobium sp. N1]|uniref:SLBB domain-containing protein n=1 Tax=Chlorobium sp. N1 TaxID=2491138 RepID=UPI001F60D015|nr:SLBB domain-containing protein [Chlorobium sp. N1]